MIITIGRKPFPSSVCENTIKNQCGGLNIERTKVGSDVVTTSRGAGFGDGGIYGNGVRERKQTYRVGRFPSNVILSESTEGILDNQSGELRARGNKGCSKGGGGMFGHAETVNDFGFGDTGGASRFFKVVK